MRTDFTPKDDLAQTREWHESLALVLSSPSLSARITLVDKREKVSVPVSQHKAQIYTRVSKRSGFGRTILVDVLVECSQGTESGRGNCFHGLHPFLFAIASGEYCSGLRCSCRQRRGYGRCVMIACKIMIILVVLALMCMHHVYIGTRLCIIRARSASDTSSI